MRLKTPRSFRLRNGTSVRAPDTQTTSSPNKHRRKALAAAAAVVILILGIVPVTYSYLTASSEKVVNTFAGGAISLTLDEAKVDTDGNPINGEDRVQENSYKVVPGATLIKDPTVTVLEGSEVCYVFLYVENPLDEDYFTLDYSSDWTKVATTGTKTLYVYKTTVNASEDDVTLTPIFTMVTVSDELTAEQIEAMGEVQIQVQAYAIQAEGIDSATSIQMAASYFETEFDFSFSDVDTSVDIDNLVSEEDSDTEESDTTEDTSDSSAGTSDSSSEDTEDSDAADSDSSSDDSGSSSSEVDSSSDTDSGSTDSSESDTTAEDSTGSEDTADDSTSLNIVE